MDTNTIPDKYRSDHLFLLVGMNPLPNYVAALILTRDGGTVHLLYSDPSEGGPSTSHFAEFLTSTLENRRPDLTLRCHGIHEASELAIRSRLEDVLQDESISGCVGLNYTGGTKPMAIHTYRVLAEYAPNSVFSYLDARRLAVFFDGVGSPYPVGEAVVVGFDELARLHGYDVTMEAHRTSKSEALVHALAQVHSSQEGHDQWWAWRKEVRLADLPDPTQYPALAPVRDAMDDLCDGVATPDCVAGILGHEKFSSCAHWFKGEWLEELALLAIAELTREFGITHYGADVELTPSANALRMRSTTALAIKNFQLDAYAILGYQLFAVSCIDNDRPKGDTKTHLFEAYVRARQLGGDEARVALVCCVPKPDILQREIEREWSAEGQLKVFGRHHLPDLADHFYDWFMRIRRFS